MATELVAPPIASMLADGVSLPEVKLDLGCGQNKREGFQGVDFVAAPGVDIVHDLGVYPWPWADESVTEIHCSHFFEHIPGPARPKFMDEVWRILKPGGKAQFVTPYGFCERAMQDYTHAWPPIVRSTYIYFDRAWRESQKLTHGHYDMKCNFKTVSMGSADHPSFLTRTLEFQAFAREHYLNAMQDLYVTLEKHP